VYQSIRKSGCRISKNQDIRKGKKNKEFLNLRPWYPDTPAYRRQALPDSLIF
jgi:hypothetical protein